MGILLNVIDDVLGYFVEIVSGVVSGYGCGGGLHGCGGGYHGWSRL